jgi:hypothetical protein
MMFFVCAAIYAFFRSVITDMRDRGDTFQIINRLCPILTELSIENETAGSADKTGITAEYYFLF